MKGLGASSLLPVLWALWAPRGAARGAACSGHGLAHEAAETSELVVNQTSGPISQLEGSSITMECTFEVKTENVTAHVEWYKQSEPAAEGQNQSRPLCLGTNSTSLTLTDVRVANTGTYVCVVLLAERNLTGRGNGTQVTVLSQRPEAPQPDVPQQESRPGLDLLLYAVFGVAIGVFFSLPAFCLLVWQCFKKNSQGKPEKREAVGVKQPGTPPPAPPTDEVTYADLNFEEEEPSGASDAVYAEVTRCPKLREDGADATYAKVKVSH